MKNKIEPYIGSRPFEKEDKKLFFGRDREINDLFSLVVSNDVVLVYGQCATGKTSLLNAGLIPLLEQKGFEIFPVARLGGVIPEHTAYEKTNFYVLSTLLSLAGKRADPSRLSQMTISGFLKEQKRSIDEDGQPKPRAIIFDQFEELFSLYSENWTYREGFFSQIYDGLEGSPLLFRSCDLRDPISLTKKLRDVKDPVSQYIKEQFSPAMKSFLKNYKDSILPSEEDQKALLNELNRLIRNDKLYKKECVKDVMSKERVKELNAQKLRSKDIILLNRLFLEEVYPDEIAMKVEGDPLLRVVFVIREDYIAQLDPYAHLLPQKLRTRFRLEPLCKKSALSAITCPLKEAKTGRSFHKDTVKELVNDLLNVQSKTVNGKTDFVPKKFVDPLQLQVVCQGIWRDLPYNVISIKKENLKSVDLNQALSDFYERTIKTVLTKAEVNEEDLREWFERDLITQKGTRGIYEVPNKNDKIPDKVKDELKYMHLIQANTRAGSKWYELIHDRFIEPIKESNRKWRERKNNILERDLLKWIKNIARNLSYYRKLEKLKKDPTPLNELFKDIEGQNKDWFNACTYLASEILIREKNFSDLVNSNSYKHLEGVWLKDVKMLKAYLNWKIEGENPIDAPERYYYNACEQIRRKLFDRNIKISKDGFEKVKEYIKSCYLADDDTVDKKKSEDLIRLKAYRVWEMKGKTSDEKDNWQTAESYVKAFYENIIPGVMEDDRDSVFKVMEAFRFSKAPENRYLIINCFETALSIYFLNPTTIEKCSMNIEEII